MPHTLACGAEGYHVGIYFACISNLTLDVALTAEQYSWCCHHETLSVCVVPCVVQYLASDYVRCVALPLVWLWQKGAWLLGDSVACSLLPCEGNEPFPYSFPFGSASDLKHRNLLCEIANRGVRLYPFISGLVDAMNMHNNYI